MNRKIFAAALAAALLAGPAARAQNPPTDRTEEKKVTTSAGTDTSKVHTVVGTVKEFTAGKKITVLVGKKTRSFSLDSRTVNTSVDPSVAVGSKVKIVESKNAEGIKSLTIDPVS